MPVVVTVAGPREGIGKTTLAVNLAAELAASGHAVGLFDLDPAAAASLALGFAPAADPWSTPMEPVHFDDDRSARLQLSRGGRGLAGARGRDIRALLELHGGGLGILLLDTPRGASGIVTGAVDAADVVLAPLPADGNAATELRSVAQLRYVLGGTPAELRAVLMRAMEPDAEVRAAVEQVYPGVLCRSAIPGSDEAERALRAGMTLRGFARRSAIAQAFAALAAELEAGVLGAALGRAGVPPDGSRR